MEDVAVGKLSRLESGATLSGAESSIPSSSTTNQRDSHESNQKGDVKQFRLPQSTENSTRLLLLPSQQGWECKSQAAPQQTQE